MARRRKADEIGKFLDDLWKQARQMLGRRKVVVAKAADAARVKLEMYLLDSKRNDLYRQLGESFFASTKRKKPSVRKQKKLVSIIEELREMDGQEKNLRKAVTKRPRKETRQTAPRARRRRRRVARVKTAEKATA